VRRGTGCLVPRAITARSVYCTVNVVVVVTPHEFAPITVVPAPRVVTIPATLGAFAMDATLATDELKCVLRVMSCVVPSLKVPVAVNCSIAPRLTDGEAGVRAIEVSVPLPTVSVVVPVTPDAVAEMVTLPAFLPWAKPDFRI